MAHGKRICLVVLGSDDALKNALITIILGKDSAKKPKNENNMFVIRPDMKKSSSEVLADMSLLVVKDGSSTQEVWDQLDKLTGKASEEFIVVLPLSHGGPNPFRCRTEERPFRCCTMEQLFSELRRMAEERGLMPAGNSQADPTPAVQPAYTSSYPPAVQPAYTSSYPPAVQPAYTSSNPAWEAAGKHHRVLSGVNLVLVGLCGSGKSASGNTILGQNIFTSRASSGQITTKCQAEEVQLGGRRVRVVDTPDIFDGDMYSTTKAGHVKKCKELCQGEPTVFLLVIHVSRFTDGERGVLKKLQAAFGPTAHERTIILFTRGDDLRQGGVSFEEFLSSCHRDLKNIVATCGSRCVPFENSDSHPRQVENLMQKVDQLL